MVIYPTEGLCNKLRVVFSFYQKTRKENEELIVIWEVSDQCNGFFLDYFEPVKNITFVRNNDAGYHVDYRGFQWCEDYSPYVNKQINNLYAALIPRPRLRRLINDRLSLLEENYVAVHVRRTDHSRLAKRNASYTSDRKFQDFIIENDTSDVYLATDNYKTQKKYLRRYPGRVKAIRSIKRSARPDGWFSGLSSFLNYFAQSDQKSASRSTSLEDAIVDVYMCVYAQKFMGSGYSSFSNLITYLRNHLTDKPFGHT